jgi:hypothetical protein
MPWDPPGPFTTGQPVTAAELNAFRDSLLHARGNQPHGENVVAERVTALYPLSA